MSRTRNYLCTFFFTEDVEAETASLELYAATCKYFVGQAEVCPRTLRRHAQFYCHLSSARSLTAMKKSLTDLDRSLSTVHLEAARGTHQECITYCTKEESRDTQLPWSFVFGQPPRPGKRKDLDEFVQEILEGEQVPKMRKLVKEHAMIVARYPKFVSTLKRLRLEDFEYKAPPLVYILHGPTGTGKTRFVHSFARTHFDSDPYSFIHTGGNRLWFDGYDSHAVLLFDEFSGASIHFNRLKQLTDRYRQLVEIKGDTAVYLPSVIFICTNLAFPVFAHAYPDATDADRDALNRRVTLSVSTADASDDEGARVPSNWQRLLFPLPRDPHGIVGLR